MGFLSTKQARDVLVKTGLDREQLRQIWNLSELIEMAYLTWMNMWLLCFYVMPWFKRDGPFLMNYLPQLSLPQSENCWRSGKMQVRCKMKEKHRNITTGMCSQFGKEFCIPIFTSSKIQTNHVKRNGS